MTLEEQPIASQNMPRPIVEVLKIWLQVHRMSESFFAQEVLHTSAKNTFLSVLIYTVISTIISIFISLLESAINYFTHSIPSQTTNIISSIIFLCCFTIIAIPIGFYLNNGISYLSAIIFGGKGNFDSQAYLASLFIIPLGLISSLLSFLSLIPGIGIYISFTILLGVLIINVIFTVRSFKVVHGFNTGRAVAAVLSPAILLLIPICLIGILMLMGPAIGNVFSTINSSLNSINTPIP